MKKPWRFLKSIDKTEWERKDRQKYIEYLEIAEKFSDILSNRDNWDTEDGTRFVSEFDDDHEDVIKIDLDTLDETVYNLVEALRVYIRKHDEWDGTTEDEYEEWLESQKTIDDVLDELLEE